MTTRKYMHGLSLVEMLIVLAVIAVLATMFVGVAGRIDTQSKEKLLAGTFALLEGALEEYKEFKGVFPQQPVKDFTDVPLHSENLYRELYSIPDSREVLEKVSDSLIKQGFDSGAVPSVPEIYDPWETALDYRYIAGENFPELISAGPDKIFGNADDITNRKK